MAIIPYDPGGIDPKVANVIDDVIVSIQSALKPAPVDVPYASSLYRASAGTWTVQSGDQAMFRYVVFGGLMFMFVRLVATSTSAGMGAELLIPLPTGYTPPTISLLGSCQWVALGGGVTGTGPVFCTDGRTMSLRRDGLGTGWPSSETNTLYIDLNLVFPVFVS